MKNILVVGQALPAVNQTYPYDSTMFYTWLDEVGISKEEAQELFIFDAVYGEFPGFKDGGGHKIPNDVQMEEYFPKLKQNLDKVDKVWILGSVAAEFLLSKEELNGKLIMKTIHPSKRNLSYYNNNKERIIKQIKGFIQ